MKFPMRKFFLGLGLALVLAVSAAPLTAFSADKPEVTIKAEPIKSADGKSVSTQTQSGNQAVATIPVNPGSTVVDFGGGFDWGNIFGVIVGALALGAISAYKFAKSKFSFVEKLLPEEEFQKFVSPILDEAVAAGVGKLKDADWLKVDTKNAAVAGAVTYALEHAGPLLAKYNISSQALREKIEAKLVQNGWDTSPGKWEA